ncbi:DUF503 domain-containing protein [Lacticigenium naphthae]|uniref:DUF503 domain-containing protein n=1 Tax=Lacticigenium naphthae TaxID=515351 RepID=UPI0004110EBA|nr:DUF503 domain-containing protein [Lacticigenium naphthae]
MILMGIEVTILIPDAYSLKEKRSVVKSMIRKTQNQFHISSAEVGDLELHNKSIVGFGIVGNDRGQCQKVLHDVLTFIEGNYPVEVLDTEWLDY